jgi:FkbM family methyltransferase
MAFVLHFLRKGDLFFDVGANVGSYTILASAVCGANTLAFEPDPGAVRALRKNIEANDIGDRVTVRTAALGSHEGGALLTTGRDTMNRIVREPGRETQTVPLTTLDLETRAACPKLLKIDIEGHEEEALRGAPSLLADPGLLAMEIETVTPASRSLLLENGFVQSFYDPMLRRLIETPVHHAHNQLWLRDRDTVQDIVASGSAVTVLGVEI